MYGKSLQIFAVAFRVAADFRKHTTTSPQIFLIAANTFLHALKIHWQIFQSARIGDCGGGHPVTCDHRLGLPIPNERLSKNTRKMGMGRGREEGGASLP